MSDLLNTKLPELNGFLYEGKQSEAKFILLTERVTNRLRYACDFVFHQGLQCNYMLTEDVTVWNNSSLHKINYSNTPYPDSLHIHPYGLLSSNGVEEFVPTVSQGNGPVLFFPQKSGDLNFDVFSAVFYCISRYEEWQKYVKDLHGRFEERNSIFYKLSCLKQPVVDGWLIIFKNKLKERFKEIEWPVRQFKQVTTIDIDNLYAFKGKPLFRNLGGAVKDFSRFDFSMLFSRMASLCFGKMDPFDKYDEQTALSNQTQIPLLYFFLYRNGTKFDRTINPGHPEFKKLFSKLKTAGIKFGIHPSYFSSDTETGIAEEAEALSKDSGQKINLSRQHYLRFNIRSTPKRLVNAGIEFDFTMGFATAPGFRAGTTLPFYYYDFDNENPLNLLAVPFALMDGAYYIYGKSSLKEAEADMVKLYGEARKVDGLFITVFHERSFARQLYPGWDQLYAKIHHLEK